MSATETWQPVLTDEIQETPSDSVQPTEGIVDEPEKISMGEFIVKRYFFEVV